MNSLANYDMQSPINFKESYKSDRHINRAWEMFSIYLSSMNIGHSINTNNLVDVVIVNFFVKCILNLAIYMFFIYSITIIPLSFIVLQGLAFPHAMSHDDNLFSLKNVRQCTVSYKKKHQRLAFLKTGFFFMTALQQGLIVRVFFLF